MKRKGEELTFHLLREHAAAEGDAAFEGDGGKICAMAALRFRPGVHRRNHACQGRAQETQETEVRADRLNAAAVFRALRTELQELHDAGEVFSRSRTGNAGNVPHLRRQRLLRGRGNERAAVRHEELEQQDDRTNENERGHHRGTTARRAGARRASSGSFQNAYAQAVGRKQAISGGSAWRTELIEGYKLRRAYVPASKLK